MTDRTVRFDNISPSLSYSGQASAGALTSSPVWQIRKVEVAGNLTSVKFANGADSFINIWDDRLSLSYS